MKTVSTSGLTGNGSQINSGSHPSASCPAVPCRKSSSILSICCKISLVLVGADGKCTEQGRQFLTSFDLEKNRGESKISCG